MKQLCGLRRKRIKPKPNDLQSVSTLTMHPCKQATIPHTANLPVHGEHSLVCPFGSLLDVCILVSDVEQLCRNCINFHRSQYKHSPQGLQRVTFPQAPVIFSSSGF